MKVLHLVGDDVRQDRNLTTRTRFYRRSTRTTPPRTTPGSKAMALGRPQWFRNTSRDPAPPVHPVARLPKFQRFLHHRRREADA